MSVLRVLTRIKSGTLAPSALSRETRTACVEHLGGEGYSAAEIAEVLKVSARTIARDRKAIQEAHAIEQDPQLGGRLAGQLVQEAERCMVHIRRAARDPQASPAVRVEAERACFTIVNETIQRFQSLGFAPSAPQQLQAQLLHYEGDLPDLEQLLREVERLQRIDPKDPALNELRVNVTRAQLTHKLAAVRDGRQGNAENDDASDT